MIFGYCRISTKSQIGNNSLEQQKKDILKEYPNADINFEQFTGSTNDRPVFNVIVNRLKANDVLVVTKLDRLCRSTQEGLSLIEMLLKKDVKIHILNMGLIDNSPIGKMIITILLAFAEFERSLIAERMINGKAIAKTKEGFREGRPKKYSNKQLEHAVSLLESNTYKEVEQLTGISKSTIVRYINKKKEV